MCAVICLIHCVKITKTKITRLHQEDKEFSENTALHGQPNKAELTEQFCIHGDIALPGWCFKFECA